MPVVERARTRRRAAPHVVRVAPVELPSSLVERPGLVVERAGLVVHDGAPSSSSAPSATIRVSTQASCANATPYLSWNVSVEGVTAQTIVIHVVDLNGTEVLTLHDVAGSVLWPGWTRVDDKMTLTNAAVATLRLHADITTAPAAGLAVAAVVTTGDVAVSSRRPTPSASACRRRCRSLPREGADVAAADTQRRATGAARHGHAGHHAGDHRRGLTLAGIVLVMRFRTDRTAA